MSAPARERLFFALWPDDATRDALASLARGALGDGNGRLVAPENLHLTLAFLGGVDAAFRACAERAAEQVSALGFTLSLAHTGCWPRAQVLWSAPEATPDALSELASALNGALHECGYAPEARPFRAHVTLARKVRGRRRATPHAPVDWRVDAFHLVASHTHPDGARYRRVRTFPLRRAPMPSDASMG